MTGNDYNEGPFITGNMIVFRQQVGRGNYGRKVVWNSGDLDKIKNRVSETESHKLDDIVL